MSEVYKPVNGSTQLPAALTSDGYLKVSVEKGGLFLIGSAGIVSLGTKTVLQGDTSVAVAHLQAEAPALNKFIVIPNTDLGNLGWWVDTVTETTVTIHIAGELLGDADFSVFLITT